jgi:uncharacterized protein
MSWQKLQNSTMVDGETKRELSVKTHRSLRPVFFMLGLTCVMLGYIGLVVPGFPGTVFFIVSLWAFKRSSPRFENWLLTKSPVAKILTQWESNRSMTPKTKAVILSVLWVSISFSQWLLLSGGRTVGAVIVLLCGVGVTIFVIRTRTEPG